VVVLVAAISAGKVDAVLGHWQVKRRVAVEESHRHEVEARVLNRHHGPVLGPDDVVVAKGAPEDDVGAVERSVRGGERGKAGPARVLVRVIPCREVFRRVVSDESLARPGRESFTPLESASGATKD
jgi:hypothetical protein